VPGGDRSSEAELALLQPAEPDAEDTELWTLVTSSARAATLSGDALREALLTHAVTALSDRLGDDPDLQAFADVVQADDDDDRWFGTRAQAQKLGISDDRLTSIMFLMAETTTSFAGASPYAQALTRAAARRFASDRSAESEDDNNPLARFSGLLTRFLDAQYELTSELLTGRDAVTLHRGVRISAALRLGPANHDLRPLSSFSVTPSYGVSLAHHGADAAGRGSLALLSARVPSARVLATPATGAGAALEREFVIAVGAPGDRLTVSVPDK
jgi:hypothetical protein